MVLIGILAAVALVLLIWVTVSATIALLGMLPGIAVGLLAGWAAGKITNSPNGLLGDLLVGLAGSIIGPVLLWLVSFGRLSTGSVFNPLHILASIAGAVLLLWALRALRQPQGNYQRPRFLER